MSSFVPYRGDVSDSCYPACAPKHSRFEFAFRLEPIVQGKSRLLSAFAQATSDFLNLRGVVYLDLSRLCLGGGFLRLLDFVSLWFRPTSFSPSSL